MTAQPRRSYFAASVLGVSLWATYVVGAGYVAGRAADSVWVSIGIALALLSIVSVVAAVRARRRPPEPMGVDAAWEDAMIDA
jgi:membrane protein DedA with SNARE-associated domain